MKVVILDISWKKFRGRAVCVKTTPILGARMHAVQTVLEDREGQESCL